MIKRKVREKEVEKRHTETDEKDREKQTGRKKTEKWIRERRNIRK